MRVLGLDPGVTTGAALYDEKTGVVFAEDTESPRRLYRLLESLRYEEDFLVVAELYVGAGPRTQEAVHTIKVLGFVEFLCKSWGVQIVLQAPQQRKYQVSQASRLLPEGPHHAKDALAHVLAFLGVELIR